MESPLEVLAQITRALEDHGVLYVVVGSFASSMRGLYRATADIDIVADLRPEQVHPLVTTLQAKFYIDEQAVSRAVSRHGSFNAIHFDAVFKVDVFVTRDDDFDRQQFARRRAEKITSDAPQEFYVATAEDTILAKLLWYRSGGEVSDVQWADVLGIIGAQGAGLDVGYLREWGTRLAVRDLLERALSQLKNQRMRINVIGGGPAGLYFALLMKRHDAAHEITVFERNPPDATFGWGVVFSGRTLRICARPTTSRTGASPRASRRGTTWTSSCATSKITIRGNDFSGIARLRLLNILQERCRELGVRLRFRHGGRGRGRSGRGCDLLVGADGVGSLVRERYAEEFRPTLERGAEQVHLVRHAPTLPRPDAHLPRIGGGRLRRTLLQVRQTTEHLHRRMRRGDVGGARGFDRMSDAETRALPRAGLRATTSKAQELLSNNSKWINFLLVRNAAGADGNVVLLGDALHTAHFSIGSGTKLALEDSIALYGRLVAEGGFLEWAEFAGNLYGTPRQPVLDQLAAGRPVILEIDLQGARQVRRAMPEARLVFLAPPSWDELVRRLAGRGTEPADVIERRLAVARDELAAEPEFDVTLVNTSVPEVVAQLVALAVAPGADVDRRSESAS